MSIASAEYVTHAHAAKPANAAHLRMLTRAWACVAALVGARLVYTHTSPVPLGQDLDAQIVIITSSAALLLSAYVCLLYTSMDKLALVAGTLGILHMSGLSAVATQFMIFHTGRAFPLVDAQLAAIDAALGFDWTAYFDVFCRSPLFPVLSLAYQSIWIQPVALFAIHIVASRVRACYALQIALPLSFAITCVGAILFPALGAYEFHGVQAAQHPAVWLEFTNGMTAPIQWLRHGDMMRAVPHFPDIRVISFPSWHGAAAAIFVLSAWRVPGWRVVFLLLNAAMLAAAPIQGSHYLSDILAGVLIGAVTVAISERLVGERGEA